MHDPSDLCARTTSAVAGGDLELLVVGPAHDGACLVDLVDGALRVVDEIAPGLH